MLIQGCRLERQRRASVAAAQGGWAATGARRRVRVCRTRIRRPRPAATARQSAGRSGLCGFSFNRCGRVVRSLGSCGHRLQLHFGLAVGQDQFRQLRNLGGLRCRCTSGAISSGATIRRARLAAGRGRQHANAWAKPRLCRHGLWLCSRSSIWNCELAPPSSKRVDHVRADLRFQGPASPLGRDVEARDLEPEWIVCSRPCGPGGKKTVLVTAGWKTPAAPRQPCHFFTVRRAWPGTLALTRAGRHELALLISLRRL